MLGGFIRLEVLTSLLVFNVCVTVHHIRKWWDVPTWCNNCDLLS
jgi:hypothetical protein